MPKRNKKIIFKGSLGSTLDLREVWEKARYNNVSTDTYRLINKVLAVPDITFSILTFLETLEIFRNCNRVNKVMHKAIMRMPVFDIEHRKNQRQMDINKIIKILMNMTNLRVLRLNNM